MSFHCFNIFCAKFSTLLSISTLFLLAVSNFLWFRLICVSCLQLWVLFWYSSDCFFIVSFISSS